MLTNQDNYCADSFRNLSPKSLDMAVLELCREKRKQQQHTQQGCSENREENRR